MPILTPMALFIFSKLLIIIWKIPFIAYIWSVYTTSHHHQKVSSLRAQTDLFTCRFPAPRSMPSTKQEPNKHLLSELLLPPVSCHLNHWYPQCHWWSFKSTDWIMSCLKQFHGSPLALGYKCKLRGKAPIALITPSDALPLECEL